MRYLFSVVSILSIGLFGFARLQAGEKLPNTSDCMELKVQGKKLILVINSANAKNLAFFERLHPLLPNEGMTPFIVDSQAQLDQSFIKVIEQTPGEIHVIQDQDRKIINALGVIIRPTLFLVSENDDIYSVFVGNPPNLTAMLKANIAAWIKGEPQPDVLAQQKAKQQRIKINACIQKGQALFLKGNYALALAQFEKALELSPSQKDAQIGKVYSMLMKAEYSGARDFLDTLGKGKAGKRFQFAHSLSNLLESFNSGDATKCMSLYKYEHFYFPMLMRLSELLEQAERYQESLEVSKQSYKVLFKHWSGLKK